MVPLITQGNCKGKELVHCSTTKVESTLLLLDQRFGSWSEPSCPVPGRLSSFLVWEPKLLFCSLQMIYFCWRHQTLTSRTGGREVGITGINLQVWGRGSLEENGGLLASDGNKLLRVKEFTYLSVIFLNEGKMMRGIDAAYLLVNLLSNPHLWSRALVVWAFSGHF